MKVKVIKRFIDRETQKLNEVGSVIEVTEPRFKEITAAGAYIEAIEEPAEDAGLNLGKMNLEQLKEYAKKHGVDLKRARTKAAIQDAIADALI